ncbi:hypothetical protein GX645_02570 [Candidatus Sumerlaeota bacterium]|nr:hypothetical protein [Candidatus Sumerlaeota bacterium]
MRHMLIHSGRGGRRALSVLEVLLGSMIVSVVMFFLFQVVIMLARESRVGVVQAEVSLRADMIQDKLFNILRHVSYNNIVQFSNTDAVPGQSGATKAFFYRIIFRKDEFSPYQELRFDPVTKKLVYDPDRSSTSTGDEVDLNADETNFSFGRLDYVWFGCGLQPGGLPDNSIILTQFAISDHGEARKSYRNQTDENSWIQTNRSFGVFIRNK